MFEILLEVWCKETAYPSCQKEYVQENDPTYGQCAITATLVYDMFGGTIHKIRVSGGGTHYFNKINEHYIDLTSDQFDLYNIYVDYSNNELVKREDCGKNADTLKRYKLLVQAIDNKVNIEEYVPIMLEELGAVKNGKSLLVAKNYKWKSVRRKGVR